MKGFDAIGSQTVVVSGTAFAAAGTFSTTGLDLTGANGVALVALSVHAAGTGTLNIFCQEGTAVVSAYSNLGTAQIFNPDTGAGTNFAQIIAGGSAIQYRAIDLDKTNKFIRWTFNSVDSSYRVTINVISPSKYVNFS